MSPLRVEVNPQITPSLIATLREFGYTPATTEQVSVFDGKGFEKHDIVVVDPPSAAELAGIAER
jgi:hypothetical protein